jgi:hypothetical protein
MKEKNYELGAYRKNKNIWDLHRGINEFKKGYQLRTNIVKDENGDLLADSHSILNRWKSYFCQQKFTQEITTWFFLNLLLLDTMTQICG